jgi:murein DD-endopeptidase MepM/ murein hydrolase activator NlpD
MCIDSITMVFHRRRDVMACISLALMVGGCSAEVPVVSDDSVHPSTGEEPGANDRLEWSVYDDKRFDFRLEYPMSWRLSPRHDLPDVVGEVVTLSSPVQSDSTVSSIAIGHYLEEIASQDTVAEWTARYPAAFEPSLIRTTSEEELPVHGGLARYIRGASPLTEYQYTNIRRGTVVWFIWANFGDSADAQANRIYRTVVDSFRFGPRAPTTLGEIVSNVPPSSVPEGGECLANLEAPPVLAVTGSTQDLKSAWWAPVLMLNGQQWPVTCGSPWHTDGAYYAADVEAPLCRNVYAARPGTVEKSGWDTSGYGNLVKIGPIDGSGHRHLYGHLDGIDSSVVVGSSIGRGSLVGLVGNTGNTSGTHLHFHVQNGQYQSSSNGLSLIGMWGFTDNPSDPYYPSNDGVNHPSCAWMGR